MAAVEPKTVEVEIVPNTKKLESLTAAIIILLEDLAADFKRFRTSLEYLGE